jgi:hypothetical protein
MKRLAGLSTSLCEIGILISDDVDENVFTDEDFKEMMNLASSIYDKINTVLYCRNPEKIKARIEQRNRILALFPNHISANEIPNEYWGKDNPYGIMSPWFSVTTKEGIFKIGWRKNVINIDWSETKIRKSCKDLFSDQDTTKGIYYIHAHGYEDAAMYIERILESAMEESKNA